MFQTSESIGRAMIPGMAGPQLDALTALLDDDPARAYEIAEEAGAEHLWTQFVMAGAAWIQGFWLRSMTHLSLARSIPVVKGSDRHFAVALTQMYNAYAPLVEGFSVRSPRPTLAATLIVRNEEAVLRRCLTTVQGVVDELVVVDTGSTDATVSIAQEFGARIGRFEWCDHFGEARNAALSMATTDWVLSIDADEWLDHRSVGPIHAAIHDSSILAMPLAKNSAGSANFITPRLFPRVGARWEGALHESVHVDRDLMAVPYGPFILHYDWNPETVGKRERNKRIIESMSAEQPDLAAAYLGLENAAESPGSPEAIDALELAWSLIEPRSALGRKLARTLLSNLVQGQRFERADQLAAQVRQSRTAGLWSIHYEARRAWATGDRRAAKSLAAEGLRMRDVEGPVEAMRSELNQILLG